MARRNVIGRLVASQTWTTDQSRETVAVPPEKRKIGASTRQSAITPLRTRTTTAERPDQLVMSFAGPGPAPSEKYISEPSRVPPQNGRQTRPFALTGRAWEP